MTTEELVQRLIELQQNAEDSADEALMSEKYELYGAYKFYSDELHEIIEAIL